MNISLISCMDRNRGIGYENKLLAHLPSDLSHFKSLTEGKICIMGRNTHESIIDQTGSILPNRTSMILTRDVNYEHIGAFTYNSIHELLRSYKNSGSDDEVMVIGGSKIYEEFLPYANTIYLTIVDHEFTDVDTYFPPFSLDDWEITHKEHNKMDNKNPYDYSFVKYQRKEV